MDHPLGRIVAADRHCESVLCQFGMQARIHAPPYDFACGEIFDGGNVKPTLVGRAVGDIGHPNSVRRVDAELALKQVWRNAIAMFAVGGHGGASLAPRR